MKPQCVTIQMKAIVYFHVVLVIMLYKVVLTFKSVGKTMVWTFKWKLLKSTFMWNCLSIFNILEESVWLFFISRKKKNWIIMSFSKTTYLNVLIIVPLPLVWYTITIFRRLVYDTASLHTWSSALSYCTLWVSKQCIIKLINRNIFSPFYDSFPSRESHRLVRDNHVRMSIQQWSQETVATAWITNEKRDGVDVTISFVQVVLEVWFIYSDEIRR